MGDTNTVLRLRGYRGPGRPRKYDSEDERRIARKVQRRVPSAAARWRRNLAPHTEDGTSLPPHNNVRQRTSGFYSPPPLGLATSQQRVERAERVRRGPGRPRKYETAEERRMARTFQTRARRERNRLLAMEQRVQNQSLVKSEENDHDRDRDNGLRIGAVSASAHSTGTSPMSFPRGLGPSLLPTCPPSNRHSHVPTSGPHYTEGASDARYDPSSTNTSSPMSLRSILNPSNDDPVSKSIHQCTGLEALPSTPFVQILSSLESRYSTASFSTPLPPTDLPATSDGSIGIRLPRLITSPMLATLSKDKPNLRSPFPLTPHPAITNLHDALAEVDRLRERCRASFEYIAILERANESLRMNHNMNGVTSIQTSVSTMVSPVSPTTRTWSKLR